MKIGIDIDDVVAEFIEKYLEFYKKNYGPKIFYKDFVDYRIWKMTNLSKEEAYQSVYNFYNSSLFDEIKLLEGVQDSVKTLSKNHEIIFITSRPNLLRGKTNIFLKNHFPEINFKTLFSGEWSHHNQEAKSKGKICLDNQISFMIEDNHTYAEDCAEKGIKVFLLDKPWNQEVSEHENITRVKDWKEILGALK